MRFDMGRWLASGLAAAALAHATVVEDPDRGRIGDFFKDVHAAGAESAAAEESLKWVETTRQARGLTEPLRPATAEEAAAELEEPPLAPDEVRFAVDEEEGRIEYQVKDEAVALDRNARVSYQDMVLTADRIRFYSARDLIIAEGFCELTDPSQTLLGVRMAYDNAKNKGVVLKADAESPQGFYGGTRVKRVGEKVFDAERGSFTTCDLGNPHYRFWSPQLRVFMEDKVVARPAVLFAGNVPVAAAPFYFFYLRKDRHSGFLPPYIRFVSDGDFTVNNGFYWVLNDYADVTFYLDYHSTEGWQESANLIYLYGSRSSVNNFYASHMRQRPDPELARQATEWWKIYTTHRQDFTDACAALLRLDLRNNTDYDSFMEADSEIRMEQSLESFLTVSQNWTNYQISAEARMTRTKTRENDTINTLATAQGGAPPHGNEPFDGTIQRDSDPLPRILFYANRREIGKTAFYYQYGAEAAHYYDFENDESLLKQGEGTLSTSRPFTVFHYFHFNPTASAVGDFYDRDRYGPNPWALGTWNTSVEASTKFYGIFNFGETVFRHTVNPSTTHYYRPPFDQTRMVEGGALQAETNSLAFNLQQNFDLKLPERTEEEATPGGTEAGGTTERYSEEVYQPTRTGGKPALGGGATIPQMRRAAGAGTVVNLASWSTSTTYNLAPDLDPDILRSTDLINTLEFNPNFREWYYLQERVEFENDFYSLELKNFSVTTSLAFTSAAAKKKDEGDGSRGETSGTDPYGRERKGTDPKLDPNVYNIDTISGRRYNAGEGMGQGWNLSLAHDYSWNYVNDFRTNALKAAFSFDLTKKWRLGYDTYYDFYNKEIVSEHYRIYRNLHRWEAEIRISFERKNLIYWFQIRLVDLPEVQLYGQQHRMF